MNKNENSSPQATKIYVSRIARIWRDEKGIVQTIYVPNAKQTIADTIRHGEILAEIGQGQKVVLLVDMSNLKAIDRESRKYGVEDAVAVTAAVGLFGNSFFTRTIGNLWLRINKPPYPTRIFADEVEAYEWLLQYVEGSVVESMS